jgi:hypothetical protein
VAEREIPAVSPVFRADRPRFRVDANPDWLEAIAFRSRRIDCGMQTALTAGGKAGLSMQAFLAAAMLTALLASPALAQTAPVGQWSGTVAQNIGSSGYSVTMTITATGASTDYPELSCGGKLTPAGVSGEYLFFAETITRGRIDQGGRCIDGMTIIAPAEGKLAWGWFGSYKGKAYVASSVLTRR